jgi:putative restriction endonuclease
VTRERALPTLDAAHIRRFSERPEHDVRNGLLLRSDVHRLFDAGYVTVTPRYKVEVSHRVRDDFNDGENYLRLATEGSAERALDRCHPQVVVVFAGTRPSN